MRSRAAKAVRSKTAKNKAIWERDGRADGSHIELWPEVTNPRQQCAECTWAFRGGSLQVKVRNSLCTVHKLTAAE